MNATQERQKSNKKVKSYLLSGSALPSSNAQIFALAGCGIKRIISIHEYPLTDNLLDTIKCLEMSYFHYTVIDRTTPSVN